MRHNTASGFNKDFIDKISFDTFECDNENTMKSLPILLAFKSNTKQYGNR